MANVNLVNPITNQFQKHSEMGPINHPQMVRLWFWLAHITSVCGAILGPCGAIFVRWSQPQAEPKKEPEKGKAWGKSPVIMSSCFG